MSKSLGNGIDPLDMIDQYGADALRLTLVTGNSPGNDMRFSDDKVKASRNFANKIWNAARFIRMNLSEEITTVSLPEELTVEDMWIVSKYNTLVQEITDNLEKFELGIAVQKLYDFIWSVLCDWYIELVKARLNAGGETAHRAQQVLVYVFSHTMELLHPFMPFITEELWQALPHEGESIMVSPWPQYQESLNFQAQERDFEHVMDAIKAIRNRRSEMNVPPSRKVQITIATQYGDTFAAGAPFFQRLASASEVHVTAEAPTEKGLVEVITHAARVFMPLAELVDIQEELKRIAKEKEKALGHLKGIEAKLNNEAFTAKAPANIVQNQRDQAEKLRALIAQLDQSAAAMEA